MTMDLPAEEFEYLTTRVISSKEPVTYHSLSTQRNLHHGQAKQILYEFYRSNKDKIVASFLITGSTGDGKTLIKLCEDEVQLSDDIKLFATIHTIHVYCVHIRDVTITHEEIALLELQNLIDLAKLDRFYQNGLIKGPALSATKLDSRTSPTPSAKPSSKSSTPSSETKPKTPSSETKPKSMNAGLSSGYVSRKAQAQAQAQTKPSTSRTSNRAQSDLSSSYVSRKSEAAAKAKAQPKRPISTESAPSGYQYKSRKIEKQQPREKVVVSNVDNDPMEVDSENVADETPAPKKPSNSDIKNLFLDDEDFSDFSDDDDDKSSKQPKDATPDEQHQPEAALKDTDVEPVADLETNAQEAPQAEPTAEPESQQTKASEQEESQPETTVDEDGYIIRRKKPTPPTKSAPSSRKPTETRKPAASAANKKSGQGSKKQTSLMNFFQKR